ncbi:alanine racemase [Propionivibrio limicola]|uniref:alanine racemase n=1 Tax=Propionivibrio limicola TaxID=167645 RepID=UPI0012916BE8|nr:alanine racemase [Propionivibrio limicola]
MPRPIQAHINSSAIRHNYLVAKRFAASGANGAKAWAVVKANAYGHGLFRIANALRDVADGFALLEIEAAIALREAGFQHPILLMEGFFDAEDLAACIAYGFTACVHQMYQLQMIRKAQPAVPMPIYLKLNTGMNRLGFVPEQIPALRSELAQNPAIGSVTLMMHFAEADGERGIDWQVKEFAQMCTGLDHPVSMANSAAIINFPQTAHDWVRPGIMLYGSSPFADVSAKQLELTPVMTLTSRILAVQKIQPGERVGYGGTFVATRPTRVGIVACGYADGYPRHASTGTPILVNGVRTQTLGRVSMDMLACDLTDLPEADIGAPVVLWGEGLSADEVAAAAGTISYELFCALAPRVPVVEI